MVRFLLVTVGMTLAGCGGGRVFAAPAVAAADVVTELDNARLEGGQLTVRLEVDNQSEREVHFRPSSFKLLAPDGTVYTASGEPRSEQIRPRGFESVKVRFAGLPLRFENAPGFYLLLDGFTAGGESVQMPAMPLGHPVTEPDGTVRVRRLVAAATPEQQPPASPVPETTCALLPLGDDAVTALVRARLEAAGWTVVDVGAKLSEVGARTEAMACRTGECIRELGGAFDVPFLLGGSVAKIEGEQALTLRLMSVGETRVVARTNALLFSASEALTTAALDEAIGTLVGMD